MWKKASDASYMWLQFDRALGFEKDLYVCLAYVSPESSTHYNHPEAISPFDSLTEDIAEICTKGGDVLLAGDFNARTADKEDFINREVLVSELLADVPRYTEPVVSPVHRQSADLTSNHFGGRLLQLCQDADLLILNGRTKGDEHGKFTCHASNGRSVVDYFISNASILRTDPRLHVQDLQPESDHCPLTLALQKPGQSGTPTRSGGMTGMAKPPLRQLPKL